MVYYCARDDSYGVLLMSQIRIIKDNWGRKSIEEIAELLNVSVYNTLVLAFELNLHRIETPNISRRWADDEQKILKDYSKELTIKEASNLLYRSYQATYQRVRYLSLTEMINKR